MGSLPNKGLRSHRTESTQPPGRRVLAFTETDVTPRFHRTMVPLPAPLPLPAGPPSAPLVQLRASPPISRPHYRVLTRAVADAVVDRAGRAVSRFLPSPVRSVLLCPGPVLLSASVQRRVRGTTIGHREPEFSQLLRESAAMLKPTVGLDPAAVDYRVALITGSGTAANESMMASIGSLGPTLVLTNGEFGERLLATARRHNPDVGELRFAWQEKIDLGRVRAELARRPYALVVVAHHETSTGMLNPVESLARLAHRHGALIAVDAVSSIGAEVIDIEGWGIDVLTGSSGKALSAMPGVGIVVVRDSALERSAVVSSAPRYLDLHAHCGYLHDREQTPNTPAVHVFVSLHAALEERTRLGEARARLDIAERASFARGRLTEIGLEFVDHGAATSSVLTCVWLPGRLPFATLAARLKAAGIVVYNGKGPYEDRMFQIGHIGALQPNDTRDALRHIEAGVREASRVDA
jgi:2-aminoethylphosphonate-pyruvate transaminase